jgi:hypothetical protein
MVQFSKILVLAIGLLTSPFVLAQRPTNVSICDYYTTALLMNNTAENQMTILTLVVNTAVIGNYTQPNVGIAVPGILAPGVQDGVPVSLLKYFNGSLMSTNRNGIASSVNFLDDGGAAPLMMNKPSNTNTSAQYFLLTHLYEYFGMLLGCSQQSNSSVFPQYMGQASMFQVHKFMNLSQPEIDYFITQVGLSAASFGVATSDVLAVGMELNNTFNQRCSPPVTIIPYQGSQLQAICINPSCPLASGAVCVQYSAAASSMSAAASGSSGSMGGSAGSMSAAPTQFTGAANNLGITSAGIWGLLIMAFLGAFGFVLIL